MPNDTLKIINRAKQSLSKFTQIVIWGFNSPNNDSFRHIMQSFYSTGNRLGIPTIWVDDDISSSRVLKKGSLVIAVNIQSKHLAKREGVYYCLHNFDASFTNGLDRKYYIKLQVYTNDADQGTKKIGPARRFDKKNQVLYQPWGTDLWPDDFLTPTKTGWNPFVYWVGSIWDNEQKQGNLTEIRQLKKALIKHLILFSHKKFASDEQNILYMRKSRIAPAIAGSWQVKKNYLPCRLFKNISYGQLGITNVPKFKEIFNNNIIYSKNIDKLIERALSIPTDKWQKMIRYQQQIVKENYTYVNSLYYISEAFYWIKK